MWVQSLVGDLRFCKPWSVPPKKETKAGMGQPLIRAQGWPPQLLLPIQTPRAPSSPSLPVAPLVSPSHSGSLYMPRPRLRPVSWKEGGCLDEGTRGQAGTPVWENSFMSPSPTPPPASDLQTCNSRLCWPPGQGDVRWPVVLSLLWGWGWGQGGEGEYTTRLLPAGREPPWEGERCKWNPHASPESQNRLRGWWLHRLRAGTPARRGRWTRTGGGRR